MSENVQNKSKVRNELKLRRRSIPVEQREQYSDTITRRVIALPQWEQARVVFLYVDHGSEVRTRKLIEAALQDGKTVLLPRVIDDHTIEAVPVSDPQAGLTPGRFGIPAPGKDAGKAWQDPIDLVLCPGVAFTETGQRIGQGSGYYDRFLEHHPCQHVLGLAFDEQVVDQLPLEPHDMKIHGVITPTRLLGGA